MRQAAHVMTHVPEHPFCLFLVGLHHDAYGQDIIAHSIMEFLGKPHALCLHPIDIGHLLRQFGLLPVQFPAIENSSEDHGKNHKCNGKPRDTGIKHYPLVVHLLQFHLFLQGVVLDIEFRQLSVYVTLLERVAMLIGIPHDLVSLFMLSQVVQALGPQGKVFSLGHGHIDIAQVTHAVKEQLLLGIFPLPCQHVRFDLQDS